MTAALLALAVALTELLAPLIAHEGDVARHGLYIAAVPFTDGELPMQVSGMLKVNNETSFTVTNFNYDGQARLPSLPSNFLNVCGSEPCACCLLPGSVCLLVSVQVTHSPSACSRRRRSTGGQQRASHAASCGALSASSVHVPDLSGLQPAAPHPKRSRIRLSLPWCERCACS